LKKRTEYVKDAANEAALRFVNLINEVKRRFAKNS